MNLPMHPAAEREANRAGDRYARDNPPVAARFYAALDRAVDAIAADPRAYPTADDAPDGYEVRDYLLLPRFPYRVVYWVTEPQTIIVAVAHTSREPGYWTNRLPEA